jgi:hypothetical protein
MAEGREGVLGMSRSSTTIVGCPVDDCEGELEVTMSPYIRGGRWDPPEASEIEDVVGVGGCVHADMLTEQQLEAVRENVLEVLAEEAEDARAGRD